MKQNLLSETLLRFQESVILRIRYSQQFACKEVPSNHIEIIHVYSISNESIIKHVPNPTISMKDDCACVSCTIESIF